MRATSPFTSLAAAAIAATVLAAPPVAAQESAVEATNEATGGGCDPCQIHLAGESHITNVLTGSLIAECQDEVAATIGHDGVGEMDWTGVQHTASACLTDCSSQAEEHWPMANPGELGNGLAHLTVRFCFDWGGFDNHCNMEMQYNDAAAPHEGTFSAAQLCSGGASRYEASWTLEHTDAGNDELELVHL